MTTDIYVNNLHLGDFASFSINNSMIELREGQYADYRFFSWLQSSNSENCDIDIEVRGEFGSSRFHLMGGHIHQCDMNPTKVKKLVIANCSLKFCTLPLATSPNA